MMSLAVQCDTPREAFHSIAHIKWSLKAQTNLINGIQSSTFIFVFGDEIAVTCEEAYMLSENKNNFSYICSPNGTKGVWKPESTDYVPACLGVLHIVSS